jgi:hypothetical protein
MSTRVGICKFCLQISALNKSECVRYQVLTATSKKLALFWDVSMALVVETVSSSETSVNIYQPTRRNIPEDSQSQA